MRGLVIRHPATFKAVNTADDAKEEVYLPGFPEVLLLARRGLGKLLAKTVFKGGSSGVVIATCPSAVLELVGMFV